MTTESFDLTESNAPRSDQVNADDLLAGPATYTIREVVRGKATQPFDFMLVETDRAYRPGVTMRRLIVEAWGPQTGTYAGKRLTLYRDPTIKFGSDTLGGIRISHFSDIQKPVEILSQTTRGKRGKFRADPLPDAPAPTEADLLREEWKSATPERRAEIEARVAELQAGRP